MYNYAKHRLNIHKYKMCINKYVSIEQTYAMIMTK